MNIFNRCKKIIPPKGSSRRGFTIIELMITSAVLFVAVMGIWGAFFTSLNQIVLAREESIATDDMKDVMEKMRSTPFSYLTTVFPDGQAIDADLIGGYSLDSEVIRINYPQGTGVEPMEIEVEVTWVRKGGNTRTHTYRILRSRYL
ncbi:MAG: prepilin-type N-terminal cleavage/methylation domain-containing protein [Candidatus Omnitrophota bacterium]